MANGQGTIEIDFGGFPGSNEASVNVTGLTGIVSTQSAEAWIMAEPSSEHTVSDQQYASSLIGITCGIPTNNTGFTIYARSTEQMQGKFKLRYVWA